ncbi:lysyl-tRNA synthetase, class II [Entomortierella parvispora]|uniref:Lysine--tRNA ligase n=1 Tax=Entomortierella parvispora TaxID=205924 RepID=A0A9P3HBR6_9FUNG|nr:lysyl-tRNA synthetase, class II [Entomortierella parvispora]
MSASASLRRIANLRSPQLISGTRHVERIAGSHALASFRPHPRLFSTVKTPTVIPATVPPAVRLEELRQADIPAYPRYVAPKVPVTEIKHILAEYEGKIENGTKDESKKVTLSGRIHSKRDSSSKLVWLDLIQDDRVIQAVFNRRAFTGSDEEFEKLAKNIHRGDIVQLTGYVGRTKTGQLSVFITDSYDLLAPCLHAIPTRSGLRDPEKRFRRRHLDFLVNRESIETLKKRRDVIKFIRQFLDNRNFLEVETPILSTQAGGANAKPFVTHANALDMEMHLRVAPELYLKQLVIGGVDRVYELGKQFRNEGIDADHNPEFTTCEFYQAYTNLDGLFEITEDMLQELAQNVVGSTTVSHKISETETVELSFAKPFRKINIMECLEEKLGSLPDLEGNPVEELLEICKKNRVFVSTPHTIPRIMDKLISHFIEPECTQPTFLWGHPIIMSPLAKDIKLTSGRTVAGRFELFVAGKEIVNAYEELNDPVQQRDRFTKQQTDKENGDEEAQPMDQAFCTALEYGLPPTAGWGMGVDRVCQILTGSGHIRDVLAFPTMRTIKAAPESTQTTQ